MNMTCCNSALHGFTDILTCPRPQLQIQPSLLCILLTIYNIKLRVYFSPYHITIKKFATKNLQFDIKFNSDTRMILLRYESPDMEYTIAYLATNIRLKLTNYAFNLSNDVNK